MYRNPNCIMLHRHGLVPSADGAPTTRSVRCPKNLKKRDAALAQNFPATLFGTTGQIGGHIDTLGLTIECTCWSIVRSVAERAFSARILSQNGRTCSREEVIEGFGNPSARAVLSTLPAYRSCNGLTSDRVRVYADS